MVGMQKSGEWIVMFHPTVSEPQAAARSMQAALAGRLTPQYGNGSSSSPVVPFSVVDASRALPGADGYVFPVKSATIKVSAGVPNDVVIRELMAEPDVRSVHPNTLMSIAQGE